jgi:hypothetical protein
MISAWLVVDIATGKPYTRDGKLWDGSKVTLPRIHAGRGHAVNSINANKYKGAEVREYLLWPVEVK